MKMDILNKIEQIKELLGVTEFKIILNDDDFDIIIWLDEYYYISSEDIIKFNKINKIWDINNNNICFGFTKENNKELEK